MNLRIETTVKGGLPCIAKILHYFQQPPQGPLAESSDDCYGYEEIEFELLTAKGKPALWLNRNISKSDADRIESEISAFMNVND
jgi:hypothetical protein